MFYLLYSKCNKINKENIFFTRALRLIFRIINQFEYIKSLQFKIVQKQFSSQFDNYIYKLNCNPDLTIHQ